MATVLVVEDEPKIVELVRLYLERDGFGVLVAPDGQSALDQARERGPDLVLLDINLPVLDGLEVCRRLRAESNVPIIMLTARDDEVDKLVGLELGADDYITKPFSPREVAARVKVVLRRSRESMPGAKQATPGTLTVDGDRHEARWGGVLLKLTPTEFKLLNAFATTPGRVYTRMQLLDIAQGEAFEGYERTIDVHVKNLRQKLESVQSGAGQLIVTVHGVGYKLEDMSHA
ncbi:MAG: response regulator transcription factor [Chloroflexota bacterium]|nr:MAG: response regulator transcription factor [Chloroflexota bacterium]